ncbi:MAG: DUF222 domain-containing protein, partial [Acidimicrobiia bacterium]
MTDLPRRVEESSRYRVSGVYDTISEGLDAMAPGPVLGAYLSAVDVKRLCGYDRVVVLRAHQRMVSHYQAKLFEDMVAVRDTYRDRGLDLEGAGESGADEIRCALHLTRYSADVGMSFALDLAERLPQVFEMLSDGVIDVRRARVIEHGTCHLSVAAARGVVERIGEAALVMTTGELRARIAKLCIEADPDEAKDRYQRAVAERKLVAEPTSDGTAHLLGLDLAPDKVAGISRRINTIARSLRRDGETRTMDQLRADVYLDLLNGKNHKTKARAVIHLTADLDTHAGLSEHPGELNGFAPVIADIARQVAADHEDAEWRYTITDPETGQHVHDGVTRRRPSASQRRHIESRDRTCVFPGCRMPSPDCDIDHRTTWAEGGPTTERDPTFPGVAKQLPRNAE